MFTTLFFSPLLLISLAFSFSGTAQANTACSNFLKEKYTATHEPISIDFNHENMPRQPSVKLLGKTAGLHGGEKIILRKINSEWLSAFSSFRFDIQGDPRWFIGAMGEKHARFFGFEIIDVKTITIPDPAEFQGAVEKVNAALIANNKEPINLTFAVGESEHSISNYLEFFTNSTLRMSEHGNHLIHDMSFHSGAIFTPNRFLKAAQKRVSFVLDFMIFLEEKKGPHPELIRSIKKYVKALLVEGIDSGTAFGNLALIANKTEDPLIAQKVTDLVETMGHSEDSALQISAVIPFQLIFSTIDPKYHYKNPKIKYTVPDQKKGNFTLSSFTEDIIRQYLSEELRHRRSERKPQDEQAFHNIENDLVRFVSSQMQAFIKTQKGKHSNFNLLEVIEPGIAPGDVISVEAVERLNDEFILRFQEIEAAVETLIK